MEPASIISLILWFALPGSLAWFVTHEPETDAPTIYGDVIEIPSVSLRLHNDGGL
jgi:hypothetical protein